MEGHPPRTALLPAWGLRTVPAWGRSGSVGLCPGCRWAGYLLPRPPPPLVASWISQVRAVHHWESLGHI